MKLVSIIVPVYNVERYLQRCVQSLLNQTYQEIEILLIDDGSSDGSARMCDEFADREEHIRVIRKVNGGVSSARNAGLEEAKGVYIQFVDSDDYLEEGFTASLVEELERQDAELVISGFTFEEKGQSELKKLQRKVYLNHKEWAMDFGNLYQNYFLNSPCNKLFLAAKIQEGFPKGLSLGEDCIFVLRYLTNITKIALTDQCGYHYLLEVEGSLTKQYNAQGFEIAKLLYQKAKEYSVQTFGEFCGENGVKYVFLQDLRMGLFQIHKKTDWTFREKVNRMKQLSEDAITREAVTAAKTECSLNQRILFRLLIGGHIWLLLLMLNIGWRK